MSNDIALMREITRLQNQIDALRTIQQGWQPVFLTTPLTSTSYDGNDTVAVGAVTIDTSAVFGAPAGIKAVSIFSRAKWASATMSSYLLVRSVGATRYCDIMYARDTNHQTMSTIIPCDANGDFDVVVANANALEVILEIHGYWK